MVFDDEIITLYDDDNNQSSPTYPPPKDVWGNAYWISLHSAASNYSDKPTRTQKQKMKDLIINLIDSIPCGECKEHAKEYIKNHKINLKNRKELSNYLCKFHNSVNERLGKPIVECKTILGDDKEECSDCKVTLADDYVDYKESIERIIRDRCEESEVPMPKIIFGECPSDSRNSCLVTNPKSKEGTIYINGNEASLRTVEHEVNHWIEIQSGNLEDAKNERYIDLKAQNRINNDFHDDNRKYEKEFNNQNEPEDIDILGELFGDSFTSDDDQNNKLTLKDSFFGEEEEEYDYKGKEVEIKESIKISDDKGGIFDFLDNYYKPVADITGIDARTLNDANTPEIIGYTANALQDMFMTPLGTVISNILSGVALYSVPILMPDLPGRDKKLLAEVGAHQFWSIIRYANPQTNKIAYAQAATAGTAARNMDIAGLINTLIASPNAAATMTTAGLTKAQPLKTLGVNTPKTVMGSSKGAYFVNTGGV